MLRALLLVALCSMCSAKPGHIAPAVGGIVAAAPLQLNSAISTQSRVDYRTPVVASSVVAASPAVAVGHVGGIGAGYGGVLTGNGAVLTGIGGIGGGYGGIGLGYGGIGAGNGGIGLGYGGIGAGNGGIGLGYGGIGIGLGH